MDPSRKIRLGARSAIVALSSAAFGLIPAPAGAQQRIGTVVHLDPPIVVTLGAGADLSRSAWSRSFEAVNAPWIMVHFREFDVPDGAPVHGRGRVEFREASGAVRSPYSGRGPELMRTPDGFWSDEFPGNSLKLTVHGDRARPVRLVIDRWAYGEPAALAPSDTGQCFFDVKCLDVADPRYVAAKAVANLYVEYSTVITQGTAFVYRLPGESAPSSNRMMTASHVFRYSNPTTITCKFMYERDVCTTIPGAEVCSGTSVAGDPASLNWDKSTNCDWAIFTTNGTPGATYGMLELKSEGTLASSSALYMPQHPNGHCKEYSEGHFLGAITGQACLFKHDACRQSGTSGAPLLDKTDYRVVGVHEGVLGSDIRGTRSSAILAQLAPGSSGQSPSTGSEPNPHNPMRTEHAILRAWGAGGRVIEMVLSRQAWGRVDIYDLQGRRVQRLFEGVLGAGEHRFEWDGQDVHGSPVASGIYFVRVVAGGDYRWFRLVRF